VSSSPRCHVLYALLICTLVSSPGHAAASAQAGEQGGQAGDSNQKRDAAPGAANARHDPATRGEPLKGGDSVTRATGLRASTTRASSESPVLREARFATPHRSFGSLRSASGNVAKPVIPAARADLLRRSDVVHPASRLDPAAAVAREFGTTSSGATGRQSSINSSAAVRPLASLKPLTAGNGVIGGPHAAGRGMIGGAANGKNVLKASIDGTALRRRF
jgi:hypothetical protein